MPSPSVLWILLACCVGLLALASWQMGKTAKALRRYGGPGIIAFEMARTGQRVNQIFADWGPDGKAAARSNTHWDFGFLVGYGGLLATAWLLCRGPLQDDVGSWLGPASQLFAALAGLAALCDVGEDLALLALLRKAESSDMTNVAVIAFGFASVKWLLILIVVTSLVPAAATALVAVIA